MAQLLRTQSYPPAGELHFIDTDSIEDDLQGVFGEDIGCGAPWSPSAGALSEPFGEAYNVTMLDSDERFAYTGQYVQPYAHAARQEMPPLVFVNMGTDIGRESDEVAFAHILTQPTHLNSLYKNDMHLKPACVSSPFAAFAGQLPAEFVEDSEKKPAASYLSFPSSEANNLIDMRKTSGPRGYLCVVDVQPAKPAQPPLQEPFIGKSTVYPSLLHTPNLRMDQPESPLPASKCSEMAAPSTCARSSAPWKSCSAGALSNHVAAMACASTPLPIARNLLFEPAISCAGGAAPFSPMKKPATPPESPSASGLFCTSSILDRSSSCAEPEVASAADRAEHQSSAGQQASSPQGVLAASGAQRASKRLASKKRRRATNEFETESEEEIEQEYEQEVAMGGEGDETDEDYVGHAEVVGGIGTGRSKRIKRAPAPRMPSYGARGNDRCRDCGATQTPQWRSGPLGPRTLCNACGVRYTKWMNSKRGRAAAAVAVLPPVRCEAPAAPLRGNQPSPGARKPKVQRKKQCAGV